MFSANKSCGYEKFEEQKRQFEEVKKRENELFKERLETKLKEERLLRMNKLKKQLQRKIWAAWNSMQLELKEKSDKLRNTINYSRC